MEKKHPLLARAQNQGTPLIDGSTVIFVWEGETAPFLLGDFSDWQRSELSDPLQTAPGVWIYTLTLPENAYIEYAYLTDIAADQRILDPFNPRKITNGMGRFNQYFHMPDWSPSPLVRRQTGIPGGRITSARLPTQGMIYGRVRAVHLYQPPVPGPYPLVLVWDGQDFLRRACLPTILDNLIHQQQIQPLALAMVESRGSVRMLEYACNDFSLDFVMEAVLPFAQQNLDLVAIDHQPGVYGVLGASMGGLMALYSGLRLPGVFGKVLSLSGAFSFPAYDTIVFDLARFADPNTLRIWMDIGLFDMQHLLECNRRLSAILQERGFDIWYSEYPAGHNYTAWRVVIGAGFTHLFGRQ